MPSGLEKSAFSSNVFSIGLLFDCEIKRFDRHTRILRFVDRIRCLVFGLEFKEGRFVAWKRFNNSGDIINESK